MERENPPSSSNERPLRADARRNRARILDAATTVFAEQGASASTTLVAEQAGVAIGTVFKHFPTKPDLLKAVVKDLDDDLVAEADTLVNDSRPDALLDFCARVMAIGVENRAVIERLAETGTKVHVGVPLARVRPALALLLERAQQAGFVRGDLMPDELNAMLAAICQEAIATAWNARFRERALTLLLEGIGQVRQSDTGAA